MAIPAEAALELELALDVLLEAETIRAKLAATDPLERRLERALARAFRRQGTEFLRRFRALAPAFETRPPHLHEAVTSGLWEPLFDEAELATIDAFLEPLTALQAQALAAGARQAIADLGVELRFDLRNPRAIAFLAGRAAARVAGINQTTRRELRRLIAEGVAAGDAYSTVARRIKAQYTAFAVGAPQRHIRSRAELVAVTEIQDGYEAGNRVVADDLAAGGIPMEKSLLTVGDARVDAVCAGDATIGWIPIRDDFPSGRGRSPIHPACRCTTQYRRRPDPVGGVGVPPVQLPVGDPVAQLMLTGPIGPMRAIHTGVSGTYRSDVGGLAVMVKPQNELPVRRLRGAAIPPGGDLGREMAAWLVNRALGVVADLPRVAIRTIGWQGQGLVAEWRDGDHLGIGHVRARTVRRMALFDAVIGNLDRHDANFLVAANGSVVAIDHGLTFPTAQPGLGGRTDFVAAMGGAPLTRIEKRRLRKLLDQEPDLAAALLPLVGPESTAETFARVRWMLALGRLVTADELRGRAWGTP